VDDRSLADHRPRLRGLALATMAALILVPIAGAAEPPQGWVAATFTALSILLLVPMLGERMPWGWVGVGLALLGIVTPRGQLPAIGPALFVACGLCLVLWLANRQRSSRHVERSRPDPEEQIRAARQSLGFLGERHVAQVLAGTLPDQYVLINGLKLPRGAGDIDHLVVGPTGVFVLETKTMAGRIECDPDGNWKRTRRGRAGIEFPAYIGNPALQVQRNIYGVRECLRTSVPSLFYGTSLWIEGLVVFPHPRAELDTEHSRVAALHLEDAVDYICAYQPRRGLEPSEVDAVVAQLLRQGDERTRPPLMLPQRAQALAEVALVVPLLVVIALGVVALTRIVQAQTAVIVLAHEAARAGALAADPDDAVVRMRHRVNEVADGVGLDSSAVDLQSDVSQYGRSHGLVSAAVDYAVNLSDLPIIGWMPMAHVSARHAEWVDPFRSGVTLVRSSSP
jgi:hypothetical protein